MEGAEIREVAEAAQTILTSSSPPDTNPTIQISSPSEGDLRSTLSSSPTEFSRSLQSIRSATTTSSQTIDVNHKGTKSTACPSSDIQVVLSGYDSATPSIDRLVHDGGDQLEGFEPILPSRLPRDPLPKDWRRITHPEGQTYFYNTSKRIVTESWIEYPNVFRALTRAINRIDEFTRSIAFVQPEDSHLILDIDDGTEDKLHYYYTKASSRRVFWLKAHDISDAVREVRGDLSATHLRLYLEYEYWYHWELFPQVNSATKDVFELVSSTITDCRADVFTSPRDNTVHQTTENLKEMSSILENSVKLINSNSQSPPTWCVGRIMILLLHTRFINYHGERTARLNFTQRLYNEEPKPTWLFKILSLILFTAPCAHLQGLNDLWVDFVTIKPRWINFFTRINGQWREHVVHASILLNANISFLAIPSNDPSNNSSILFATRRASQVASYVSVVASFASMMLALILVHEHKVKERDCENVEKFHEYFQKRYDPKFGFEGLAIIFSLPYALLQWAMGTFLLAFFLMCVVKSTTAVRSIVSLAIFIACGLIFWCVWMFWDTKGWLQLQTLKSLWAPAKQQQGRSINRDDINDSGILLSDIGMPDTGLSSVNHSTQPAASHNDAQADVSHSEWLKHNLLSPFLKSLTRLTSRLTSASGITAGSQ
ncbi:hypothetical protein H0H92_005536, partial [Tricholoma furcatifolium]